jgi:FAD/FMN-containing dehydrogenase
VIASVFKGKLNRPVAVRLATALTATVLLLLTAYASTFVVSYDNLLRTDDRRVASDVARLSPTRVERIAEIREMGQLQAVLADARKGGLKVSISGSGHSQGGHTYSRGGVVLNMHGFNRIRSIDPVALSVTVESGATWDEVQRAIAPHGLALEVMQSSNIFTVRGSLSANAHGRDVDVTQMVEVVQRFALLLADGSVVEVSRSENPELFSLVIGGYGLYGVILDVTLRVARDELYGQRSAVMDYTELPGYFAERIASDPDVALMVARPSIDLHPELFLRELVVATWRRSAAGASGTFELAEEAHVVRDKFLFGLSRRFDWAKSLRWSLQKKLEPTLDDSNFVSRNNAMRPPVAPIEFLEYRSRQDTDILQEYFVPVEGFVPFMDRFREILVAAEANVLSVTVRHTTPDSTAVLSYAPGGAAFAIVLLSNVGLSAEAQARAQAVTRQLVEAALDRGGTYYLTYQLYPTPEQLHRAYPAARRAFDRKRFYDPAETFTNQFYERYGHTPAL